MAASGAPLPARGTQTPSPASREPASPARGLRALLQTSAPRPPRRPSPYLGGRHFRSRRHLQLLLGYPEEQQHGDPEHPEDRQRQAASQTPHGPVCLAFSPALRPWGTPWRSGSEGQESARAAAPGFRCRAGGKLLGRGPARFGEKEAGAGVSGRRAAGKDRRAAKLDTRSRRRSAVAAEMLPEPPPPPQPRPPPPPRGKRTGAAGREESEAVPGTPGGTQGGGRRGSEGRAWARQSDSEEARAGASGALQGGATAARRPRRTVLLWGRPSRAPHAAPGPAWAGAGPGRTCAPAAPPPQRPAGTSGPTRARQSGAWEDFPARRGGCTWRSLPGPAPNAPAFREPAWDRGIAGRGRWRSCSPNHGSLSWAAQARGRVRPAPQGVSTPACRCLATFSA